MKRLLAMSVPLAVAVAAALSSCGSGSTTSSLPDDALSKAAAATMELHGARVSIDTMLHIDGVPDPVHMTGSGVVDAKARRSQLNLDMSDLAGVEGGDQIDASKLHMEELLDGFTLYMRSPLFTSLPGGKKWVKVDLEEAGKAAGFDLGAFQQPGQGDPSQWLQFLRSSSQIEKVGTETVRGVETTHYKGVSHFDKLADAVPAADRKAAKATADQLTKFTGITSVPLQAWIDSRGLVRRIRLSLAYKHLPGSDQGMSVDMTEELYDFGAKVDASAPPADEVYDVTDVTKQTLKDQVPGG